MTIILGVVKKNPLFLHEIEWKNNRFLFTTPNISCHVFLVSSEIHYYLSDDKKRKMR